MRTKKEIINFLESKVGTIVPCKGNSSLDGQCVTLIKALMEFLGVPNPYKARGHAKTVISAYLSEKVANPGTGFISVFSNKNMGDGFGHIWCNVGDGNGTYYESNGQKPLTVSKGKTYTYDNVCNFDKYIKEETMPETVAVEKTKFEELVKKSTKYDTFVAIGFKEITDVKELQLKAERLEKENGELRKKLEEKPITPPDSDVKYKINGKTETFTTKEGVQVTINYTIDQ